MGEEEEGGQANVLLHHTIHIDTSIWKSKGTYRPIAGKLMFHIIGKVLIQL